MSSLKYQKGNATLGIIFSFIIFISSVCVTLEVESKCGALLVFLMLCLSASILVLSMEKK